jgi:hypothetical protein
MLSKIELEFLKSPQSFNADYGRVLRHRIKAKTAKMRDEISLLADAGLNVMENCNGVREFCNGQQNQKTPNQAAFNNKNGGPSRTRTGDLWLVKPTS